jgi:hypothetical protein
MESAVRRKELDSFMKQDVKTALQQVPLYIWYIIAGVATGIAYLPARAHMIAQNAWLWVIQSNVTLNFVLIFFIWGMLTDRISKDRGWKTSSLKSWMLFFIGIAVLITIFSVIGGYETRW